MASQNYAGLNWRAIYNKFKSSGLSQRAFTLHKLPTILSNAASVPTLPTVIKHFQTIKSEFVQLEHSSQQDSKFDFKSFYFDMKAKGMSLEGYYFTYIKDKYPISRTCFLKNLESIKDSLYKVASEFLNSLKLKALKYNKKVADKEKVVFKQNSLHLTLKDLDTLECIYINENTIIPTTNMLKRHENLFKMMQINPIELQNTKLKNSVIEEGYGLVIDEEKE